MALPGLKASVERSLFGLGAATLARYFRRSATIILAYHNVIPAGESTVGEWSLHLPEDRFGDQLDYLAEHFEVVPLSKIFVCPRRDRPRVAITFDDAYVGATVAGVSQLARRGLPATIFVAPGILGRQSMWWDEFADPVTGELSARFRAEALTAMGGQLDRIRAQGSRMGLRRQVIPEWATTSTETELSATVVHPGITLGAHSWSHPNLNAIGPTELTRELADTLAWLTRFGTSSLKYLAYPYGLSSPSVESSARLEGYTAALKVIGGWIDFPNDDLYRLPRYNVPAGMSQEGFALRSVGW